MFRFYFIIFVADLWWAAGFVGARWMMLSYSPLVTNCFRYMAAGLILLPFLLYRRSFFHGWRDLWPAIAAGGCTFFTLFFNSWGLDLTSVSKASFLTSMYVVMIPVASVIIYRYRYPLKVWGAIVLALLGAFLLCDAQWSAFNVGDLLVLISAVFSCGQIMVIGRFVNRSRSPAELCALQIFFAGLIGLGAFCLAPGPTKWDALLGQTEVGWLPLAGLAIVVLGCTVFASFLQIWAQKRVESTIAGVLFLMEAPLALFFAWAVFHEQLKPMNYLGCAMMLVASIVASLEGGRKPAVRKANKMMKNF